MVSDPIFDKRIEVIPIFYENLALVSALRTNDINSPDDLGDNPTVLGFSNQCIYRTRLDKWLKNNDIIPKFIEINSYLT